MSISCRKIEGWLRLGKYETLLTLLMTSLRIKRLRLKPNCNDVIFREFYLIFYQEHLGGRWGSEVSIGIGDEDICRVFPPFW